MCGRLSSEERTASAKMVCLNWLPAVEYSDWLLSFGWMRVQVLEVEVWLSVPGMILFMSGVSNLIEMFSLHPYSLPALQLARLAIIPIVFCF